MRAAMTLLISAWSFIFVAAAPRILPLTSRSTSNAAIIIRGGGGDYDNEEEEPRRNLPPNRRGPPPSQRGPPQRGPPPRRTGGSPQRGQTPRRGPPPRRRHGPSALGTAASLAKKTVDLTTSAAWGTIKGSGKAAFYLVSPKHVSREEIWGVWRLDQQVENVDDTISCAANVEFTSRGDVLVKYGGKTYVTPYLFRERAWPQSCSIDFEARAFQGPNDDEPIMVRYKGSFRRKIADSNIVKIVGTIYEVKRKGLWKGQPRKIGTFVARRRIAKRPSFRKHEEEEDEYDEEFEDDFADENEDDDQEDEEEGDAYDSEEEGE